MTDIIVRRLKLGFVLCALAAAFVLLVGACSSPEPTPYPIPAPAATSTPMPPLAPLPTATPTAVPTATPIPTATPYPAVAQNIRYITDRMPRTPDPHQNFSVAVGDVQLIYDSLITLADGGVPVPALAKSWEVVDPTTIRLKLQEGVKFHNGEEVTAGTVRWNVERILNDKPRAARYFGSVEGATVVDKYTVDINLLKPDGYFIAKTRYLSLIPPSYWEVEGKDAFIANPVGTGPYRWTEYTEGTSYTAELRSEGHAFRNPVPERIQSTKVSEAATVVAALRTGAVDIALFTVAPESAESLVNEGVQLELRKAGLWAHFLNPMEACQNGTPVCSPLVRRALTLAIDAETIASTIWKGMAVPVSVPALPGGPGYDATLPIPFDKAEAERLLDEAGYPRGADGVRMNLVYRFWNSGPFADSAFAMQDMWRDVGIEVDTAQIEKGLFVDHYARRKGLSPWDITGIHLSELLGNNAAYLDRMTTTIAGSANVFENEAFYALRDRVNAATGAAEQDKLLREAFRMISAHDGGDPPYVYMFASPAMTFLQSYVEGFEPLGGGLNFSFENIRLLYH